MGTQNKLLLFARASKMLFVPIYIDNTTMNKLYSLMSGLSLTENLSVENKGMQMVTKAKYARMKRTTW